MDTQVCQGRDADASVFQRHTELLVDHRCGFEGLAYRLDRSLGHGSGLGNHITDIVEAGGRHVEGGGHRGHYVSRLLQVCRTGHSEVHHVAYCHADVASAHASQRQGLHGLSHLQRPDRARAGELKQLVVQTSDGFLGLARQHADGLQGVINLSAHLDTERGAETDGRAGQQRQHLAPGQPKHVEAGGEASAGRVQGVGLERDTAQRASQLIGPVTGLSRAGGDFACGGAVGQSVDGHQPAGLPTGGVVALEVACRGVGGGGHHFAVEFLFAS